MEIFIHIWNGIFKFDGIIILIGVANLFVYFKTKKYLGQLETLLYPRSDLATTRNKQYSKVVKITDNDLPKLKNDRDNANKWYSAFINTIAIFPLLGLLGTIWSLLGVVGDSSFEATQQNFLVALTSTLWGIIFAIIYKVVDATLSPKIEKYNTEADKKIDIFEMEEVNS